MVGYQEIKGDIKFEKFHIDPNVGFIHFKGRLIYDYKYCFRLCSYIY